MPGGCPWGTLPGGTERFISGMFPFPFPSPLPFRSSRAPADPDAFGGLPELGALLGAQVRHGRGVAVAVTTERARGGRPSAGTQHRARGNKNKLSNLFLKKPALMTQR